MRQAIVRSASVGCIQLPNRSFREPPLGDTRAGQSAIAGRTDLTTPVGSYLIGAVAQCTWLQARGRIGGDGVGGCVRLFGVKALNWARCGAFADGGAVEPRAGLPEASPTL